MKKDKLQPLDLEDIEKIEDRFQEEIENCEDCKKAREIRQSDTCEYHYKEWLVKLGQITATEEIKKRIKSACEFYLKYKDYPELLIKEHPEYEKEIEKIKYKPNPFFEYCLRMDEEDKKYYGVFGKDFNCSNCPYPECKEGEFIENPNLSKDYNEWLFKLAFKGIFKEVENEKN